MHTTDSGSELIIFFSTTVNNKTCRFSHWLSSVFRMLTWLNCFVIVSETSFIFKLLSYGQSLCSFNFFSRRPFIILLLRWIKTTAANWTLVVYDRSYNQFDEWKHFFTLCISKHTMRYCTLPTVRLLFIPLYWLVWKKVKPVHRSRLYYSINMCPILNPIGVARVLI